MIHSQVIVLSGTRLGKSYIVAALAKAALGATTYTDTYMDIYPDPIENTYLPQAKNKPWYHQHKKSKY